MIVKLYFGKNKIQKIFNGKKEIHQCKLKRGHSKEIFTLDWSKGNKDILISGGLDNNIFIWDVNSGQFLQKLNEANGFVKIVAIDSQANNLFSLACDQKIRVYQNINNKFKLLKIKKTSQQDLKNFQTFKSEWDLVGFFRQASWAPDDSFFIVPQGLQQYNKKKINCAFAYSLGIYDKPSLVIPNEKPVLLVRFSPTKDPLNNSLPLFQSKYKMYFAIGTQDSITIYQSTQLQPLYYLRGIHYAPLTDLSWYQNNFLLVSSMDGYISFIQFENSQQVIEFNSTVELIEEQ